MDAYLIQALWKHATETFVFDADRPCVEGGWVATAYRLAGAPRPRAREWRVLGVEGVGSKWIAQLALGPAVGPSADSDDRCGRATISFDTRALTASAIWQSDAPGSGAAALASIRPAPFFEELGLTWTRQEARALAADGASFHGADGRGGAFNHGAVDPPVKS